MTTSPIQIAPQGSGCLVGGVLAAWLAGGILSLVLRGQQLLAVAQQPSRWALPVGQGRRCLAQHRLDPPRAQLLPGLPTDPVVAATPAQPARCPKRPTAAARYRPDGCQLGLIQPWRRPFPGDFRCGGSHSSPLPVPSDDAPRARSANPAPNTDSSKRLSRRIASNSSTLDLHTPASKASSTSPDPSSQPRKGQIHRAVTVGPNQPVNPTADSLL